MSINSGPCRDSKRISIHLELALEEMTSCRVPDEARARAALRHKVRLQCEAYLAWLEHAVFQGICQERSMTFSFQQWYFNKTSELAPERVIQRQPLRAMMRQAKAKLWLGHGGEEY